MFCQSGNNLILLAASVSMALSENLTVDEIATLSDFLGAVSDNLAIAATQRDICCNNSSGKIT